MTTIFSLRPRTTNIGNDLIAIAMEGLLRERFRGELNIVTLPAVASGAGPKGSGLSSKNVYEINQLADGVVIGPGNLFENGALNVDAESLATLAVPLLVYSVSAGRIYDRTGRLVERTDSLAGSRMVALCERADQVLVRDAATAARLASCGYNDAKIGGCPSVYLGEFGLDLPDVDPSISGAVLISARHPRLMSVPYSLQGRTYEDVRKMIDLFRGRGQEKIFLVCHDYQDLSFARAFPDVPTLYTEDPLRFLSYLRACSVNVTYRLHGFLSSIALGVKAIHLSYDERATSLLETMGLADWDVDVVKRPNFLPELERRLDGFHELDAIRTAAQPTWTRLRESVGRAFADFAERVDATRAARVL